MPGSGYFVRLFERHGRDLVATPPVEANDTLAAIGEALRRAQEAAGGIVYACTCDDRGDCSETEIIMKIGEVPDTYLPC